MDALIEVKELNVSIKERKLLNNVAFRIYPSQRVYIVGENGSGKSTLLEILAGFNDEKSGDITRKKGLKIGYLIQDSSEWFLAPTVIEDTAFSLLAEKIDPKIAAQKALKTLEMLNISHLKDRSIDNLSGGEKRLVTIAGVFVREPDIFILDEPFHELDRTKIALVKSLLVEFNKPYIIVTHHESDIEGDAMVYELCKQKLTLR